MRTPFTIEEFLGAFSRYNAAVEPVPYLFYGLAILLILLSVRGPRWNGKVILAVLALVWAWMGIVYHWIFFRPINPVAAAFAAIFLLQAFLLLAASRADPHVRPVRGGASIAGWILITYALVAYPTLGFISGHGFPTGPTFGLPCPTTIFTFGLLLWIQDRVPLRLLVIPLVWSFVGASAALSLGMPEDFALPIAGVGASALILRRNRDLSSRSREITATSGSRGSNAPSPAPIV